MSSSVRITRPSSEHADEAPPPGGRTDAPAADPSGGHSARPPRWARYVIWPLIAAVLAHTFVIATWVGPNTPVRAALGPDRMRSYVMPLFEQSWMIFAPTPRRVAVNLQVRAEYPDPATGEAVMTEWVDLVDIEDELIAGNPFPPRMSLAGRRIANNLNATMGELNAEQVDLVAGNYLTTPVSELGTRLMDVTDGTVPAGTVGDYLRYDEAATTLATLVLAQRTGGDVTYIQYRTGMRYVPNFEQRHERDLDDAEITWFDYGWRQAAVVTEEQVSLFAPYAQVEAS